MVLSIQYSSTRNRELSLLEIIKVACYSAKFPYKATKRKKLCTQMIARNGGIPVGWSTKKTQNRVTSIRALRKKARTPPVPNHALQIIVCALNIGRRRIHFVYRVFNETLNVYQWTPPRRS